MQRLASKNNGKDRFQMEKNYTNEKGHYPTLQSLPYSPIMLLNEDRNNPQVTHWNFKKHFEISFESHAIEYRKQNATSNDKYGITEVRPYIHSLPWEKLFFYLTQQEYNTIINTFDNAYVKSVTVRIFNLGVRTNYLQTSGPSFMTIANNRFLGIWRGFEKYGAVKTGSNITPEFLYGTESENFPAHSTFKYAPLKNLGAMTELKPVDNRVTYSTVTSVWENGKRKETEEGKMLPPPLFGMASIMVDASTSGLIYDTTYKPKDGLFHKRSGSKEDDDPICEDFVTTDYECEEEQQNNSVRNYVDATVNMCEQPSRSSETSNSVENLGVGLFPKREKNERILDSSLDLHVQTEINIKGEFFTGVPPCDREMYQFCTVTSNGTDLPRGRCHLDLLNTAVFSCFAYLTLLILLYLRCSNLKDEHLGSRRFVGHSLRALLSLLLLLTHLVEVASSLLGSPGLLPATSALLAWVPALLLYCRAEARLEPRYLLVTSVFWLACGLARAASLYAALDSGLGVSHVAPLAAGAASLLCHALAVVDVVAVVCELKLMKQNGVKDEDDSGEVYRHHSAKWFSQVTFYWLVPLLRAGYSHPLELEDLGTLPARETAATQFHLFNSVYQEEKARAHRSVGLWRCYVRCYWSNFALGGLLKLLGDCVGFIPPLGIAVVIQYVATKDANSNPDAHDVTVAELLSNGYVMAAIVLVSVLAQGSLSQASTHIVNVEGIRLKTALQALVYDKALKLRSLCKEDDSAQESRTGNLTNLMSEDTFNIMSCYWIGHYVWAIPLKIGILMYLLYCKLGVSAIIGATCCILILTPLQFVVGKKMSVNSKDISDWSDERLRQTNEVLQGIRLIKLCGWETEFTQRILTTRRKELEFLNKDSLYWALMTFLTHMSSALITLVTLAAFYWLEGSDLSAADVFSGLALFNQLTVPLFIFPITVPIIIQALVSTRRLEEFLNLPETQTLIPVDGKKQVNIVRPDVTPQPGPDVVETSRASRADSVFGLGNITELDEPDEECDEPEPEFEKLPPIVAIEGATFAWVANEEATLVIPSLHFPRGKLTMVVGSTGGGKSSLLCALLGEIPCIKGAVRWSKGSSIAYVSQKPWLLNCSLRDNILFGRPYRSRRYNRVITATALQPDIDILPGKDMTDIGERGINLSGGQRQRVVIARALYSRANVVIMDDPLSALDQQVAQQVFEEGIRRLVAKEKRTVVMVTHNVQLINHSHQVVVIEKGRVRACGSPTELERAGVSVLGRALGEPHKGRTARERWQLIKLVSRIGLQLKQRNLADGTWHADHITPSMFVPFRRRLSRFSGSRYLTHDLPLPTDECDGEEVVLRRRRAASSASLMPARRAVTRTSSLQTPATHCVYPVKRQASSPTINNVPGRTRTYTFDSSSTSERHPSGSGSGLLRQLFSMSTQRNLPSVADTTTREHSLLRRLISTSSVKSATIVEADRPQLHRLSSTTSDCSDDFLDDDDTLETSEWGKVGGEREEREYGHIQRRIYLSYLRACGMVAGATYLVATVSWQGLRVSTDYWLSKWTEESSSKMLYYLVVYGMLSVASILLSLATNGLGQYCGARARRRLHDEMLSGLLGSPIRFFETTPLGRIMNRFSTDLGIIDKKIATSLQRLLQFLLLCFSAILVNCIITPWFITLALPICLIYYIVQKFYRCSTRELQRLDSMSRTPILSHFAETLSGLETIRAYGQQQRFTAVLFHRLDIHTNVFLIGNSCNRWLGIALDYLGGLIVFVTMVTSLVSAALLSHVVSPALVGLAINYTLLVPIYLNWVVKFLADMEMYMGSVERVTQYANAVSEDYRHSRFVPKNWPKNGDIKFQNVSLQYDSNQVITNLTLHIPAGQKVGICGRTGSGKSSLVMSLFHMVPVCEGAIYIDDVDIATLPLKVVRSRLSIIPQDVIMFSGTIRQNLDLKGQFTDAELWESLEVAQMKEVVANDLGGLDGPVREGGGNLSCGQRQLLCLARAVLHRAALLVMDEATSCLDPTTEARLLQVATRAFADATVITIAHRVSGLLGCDRVLVLDRGRIVEDASPAELLNHKMGIFSSMLRKSEEPQ